MLLEFWLSMFRGLVLFRNLECELRANLLLDFEVVLMLEFGLPNRLILFSICVIDEGGLNLMGVNKL
jgi:hypothetical protein